MRNVSLFTLRQLAEYCGKSYETLRTYYTFDGFLPDPEHTVHHGKKTTRMFTKDEMRQVKRKLDRVKWGDLSKYTRKRRKSRA